MNRKHWSGILTLVTATLLMLASSATLTGQTPAPEEAETEELKNVKILHGMKRDELVAYMKLISKSLGKKCSYCHEGKQYHLDTKKEKEVARSMMKMLDEMNKTYLEGKGTCFMCHRGAEEPVLEP